MTRKPSPALKPFMEKWEGRRSKAYLDSEGNPTIGIGHTGDEERPVKMGVVWSDKKIDDAYDADMLEAAALMPLSQACIDSLGDNQYDALVDFVFNCGPRPTATLWKVIKAGKLDDVPDELAKWNKAKVNGKMITLPGLVNRRAAEVELWLKDDVNVPDEHVSTSADQIVIEPAKSVPPPQRSATILTAIAGAAAAGPPIVNQAIQAVQPYADHSPIVQQMMGILAAIGAGLAVLGIVLMYRSNQKARN